MEPQYRILNVSDLSKYYNIIKQLGQGTYGKVLLVQEKTKGKPLAMKMVSKKMMHLTSFLDELTRSISLSCHNEIITTYPIFINIEGYYIMTQDVGAAGTLHHLIERQMGVPEVKAKRCATQLARALDFMHSQRLVHRDLKPDNVLLMDKECHSIKLCDFGLTQYIGSEVTAMSPIIPYMPPEMCALKDKKCLRITPSIDSWSFAVLLYVCLTGNYPWKGAVEEDIPYNVFSCWQKSADSTPPPFHWNKFTKEALKMFDRFLSEDPDSRPSIVSVMSYINYAWKVEDVWESEESEDEDTEEEEEDEDTEEEEEDEDTEEEEEDEDTEGDGVGKVVDPCHPVLVVMLENDTLALGSEVEVS